MSEIFLKDKYGSPITHFTQWDGKQTLYIHNWDYGLLPDVYCYNRTLKESLPTNLESVGNQIVKVEIPEILLRTPHPIVVCLYITEDGSKKTVYREEIPVRVQAKPGNYKYDDPIAGGLTITSDGNGNVIIGTGGTAINTSDNNGNVIIK